MSGDNSRELFGRRRRRTPLRRARRTTVRVPLWLVLPALLLVLAFHWVAPGAGAWYAFTDWIGIGDAHYIGLRNFRQILSDDTLRGALEHTLVLALAVTVLQNVIGLALALALNKGVKSRSLLRTIFFAPVVMAPLAVTYVWQFIFTPNGILNTFLGDIGLRGWQRPWLGDPHWAIVTVIVVVVWQFAGLSMVLYLAGLQSVPEELLEAASVDGATPGLRFRAIVFPLLAPATTVSFVLSLIFGLRLFEQILALTAGGPVDATQTLATEVYFQTFQFGRFGYGAALALMLTALITVLSVGLLTALRAREARMT